MARITLSIQQEVLMSSRLTNKKRLSTSMRLTASRYENSRTVAAQLHCKMRLRVICVSGGIITEKEIPYLNTYMQMWPTHRMEGSELSSLKQM